jgi:hypothetical protein
VPKLRDSDEVKRDRLFKAYAAKNMALCGYDHNKDLAPRMHMHQRTFNYKMRDPDKFTRKELRTLFQILKFSDEEKAGIM